MFAILHGITCDYAMVYIVFVRLTSQACQTLNAPICLVPKSNIWELKIPSVYLHYLVFGL